MANELNIQSVELLSSLDNSTNLLAEKDGVWKRIDASASLATKLYVDDVVENKANVSHNHDDVYEKIGVSSSTVATHNTSTSSHNDIRILISDLTTKLNNFLDVDDATTDQLSEVITLINNNKGTLESLTTSKINVSDIVNNLTTNSTSKVLSASQGVAIKGLIDVLQSELDSHTHTISYNDLTNKPTIPTVPTNISAFTNDSGYLTNIPSEYITETELNAKGYLTQHQDLSSYAKKTELFSGSYNDLTNKPTIPTKTSQLTNDSNFLTSVPSEYVTEAELSEKGYLTAHQDLSEYAKKTELPTKTSELTNDSGFIINTVSDLTAYYLKSETYTRTEIDSRISAIPKFSIKAVDTLPTTNISTTTVYLLKSTSTTNLYTEYIYENGAWVVLGTQTVDLTNYAKNTDAVFYNSMSMGRSADSTIGVNSAALGYNVQSSGLYSFSEGNATIASGHAAHAEGNATTASASCAHAEGFITYALGSHSHVEGDNTIASKRSQHAQGRWNIEDTDSSSEFGSYVDIVGNGWADTEDGTSRRSNAYTLDWHGNAWYQGSVTTNGADYAEYFEWLDGNPDNEDRIGLFVTLDGEKIKIANEGDEILGIISGTAAVLGDNYECEWNGKYLTDNFGRVIYEETEEFDEVIIGIDENDNPITEKKSLGFVKHPKLNPDYDPEQVYVNRANRPEWATVGMVGKLYVRDDGTCEVNGYVKVGTNGIATTSTEKTNMRVLSRINDNVIRVLLK